MTPEQVDAMTTGLAAAAGGPSWLAYALMMVISGVGAAIGSYLQEKGKNIATKEDIAELTHIVEAAKREHQAILEDLKAGHQLRMVAAERRLQAHQEAFTLWRELFNAVHTEKVGEVAAKCQVWWESNCVYLGPQSHHAFFEAFWAAALHKGLLATGDVAKVKANWEKIRSTPNIILHEVALPPLKPEAYQAGTAGEEQEMG